jgi:hypothetical protein
VATSCTFLEHGALLSRGYVEDHGLIQTYQSSDVIDKKFGIWNAVFVDHVDIHYRGGRVKGPNQYGPVLFVLDVDVLLQLPADTDVRVTRTNPVHWTEQQADEDRWYRTVGELSQNLSYGDFDKMLVIFTPDGKLDFPNRNVRVELDNPKRLLPNGTDAYSHAERRLHAAAAVGRMSIVVVPHECRNGCVCETTYGNYAPSFFEPKFL